MSYYRVKLNLVLPTYPVDQLGHAIIKFITMEFYFGLYVVIFAGLYTLFEIHY